MTRKKGEKKIETKDWGKFKIRKNGRLIISIDLGEKKEIIRVTPI
jgi:hypothetical protein